MTIDVTFASILVYLLVWVRLAGMILINPLFARNNIPIMVRNGLALFMALLLAPLQPAEVVAQVYALNGYLYAFAAVRELAVGFVFGFVFQIFYYFLFFIGDLMDTDIGLAMAKSFDPNTSVQTGFSSWIITILFTLYIFTTGSHFTLLHIFAGSFELVPLGAFTLDRNILSYVLQLVGQVFSLAIRLAAPIMVAEFCLQASMGILMRFIPQITVFVINFQLRIILGLLLMYLFAPYMGDFIDGYITTLFDGLTEAGRLMGAGAG